MSEIYRDRDEGARAKRAELLRRRRDELATMPHAVRRVVVARRARIAGAAAALGVGALFALAAILPSVQAFVARSLPGHVPAVLPTLVAGTWLAGIVVFFVARSSAEHRFAVAMSRHVLPGEDLDHDLQRLDHEKPDEVARSSAHRLEVASAALPVAAAAYVVPATAWYLWHAIATRGWPRDDAFDDWLAAHAIALASFGLLGLVAAIAMTHRATRAPAAARVAAFLAFVASGFVLVRWWFVGPAAIAATIAVVGTRLRRERALIRAEDPAAGSEVITLRGLWRRSCAAASTCRTFARAHRRPVGFLAGAITVAGLAAMVSSSHQRQTLVAAPPTIAIAPNGAPAEIVPETRSSSRWHVERCPNGEDCFAITIAFRDSEAVPISLFPGMSIVPAGWQAHLRVGYASVDAGAQHIATGFADQVVVLDQVDSRPLLVSAECPAHPVSTIVRFAPPQSWTGEHVVRLLAWPRLALSDCAVQDRAEPANGWR